MFIAYVLLLLQMVANPQLDLFVSDNDGDGLSDGFEQELLLKFTPKFYISETECDGLPAEFLPGLLKPQLKAKNGTVYGQVSKTVLPNKPGIFIEVHYYHLWNLDCGLNSHALDAEHVAVLLGASAITDPVAAWKAIYWYAAAHEDTICDASYAVRSSVIDAELQGPSVWISAGKHASFLSLETCRGGCGADHCQAMHLINAAQIVNLGERGAPMNGAVWVEWKNWPLAAKMQSDFPESVLAKLAAAESSAAISINESQAPIKAAILACVSTTGSLISANRQTDAALNNASDAIGASMDKSSCAAGNSFKRAARAFWKAICDVKAKTIK